MKKIKVGLIVNPCAGIGGAVGLKGSDGATIQAQAKQLGAIPKAHDRVAICLNHLVPYVDHIEWFSWADDMGQACLDKAGFSVQVLGRAPLQPSTQADTIEAAQVMAKANIDLLLFAGGDGTARDIMNAISTQVPVLGIPAGVKIHSGVYAVHAKGAAEIVIKMLNSGLVSVGQMEVRDIDEEAFRQGQVKASHYGELLVPCEERYLQHVKCGGKEVEALVLQDIAAYIVDQMEPDRLYILGPGTTTKSIADALGLQKTLLGVDVILNHEIVCSDASETELLALLDQHPATIIVTLIGGQGHILGRGNHQISPSVIRKAGLNHLQVISTKAKLKELEGRPLLVDTWDAELNAEISGYIQVVTGYEDVVLYGVEG